jgi:hypothetical protein
MNQLINHLIEVHSKQFLKQTFGINADTWRKHKAFVQTDGAKGHKMSKKHYSFIRDQYLHYLQGKVEEVSNVDSDIF